MQYKWKLEKGDIVWKHNAHMVECFHKISSFLSFNKCGYNYISIWKKYFIFFNIEKNIITSTEEQWKISLNYNSIIRLY